MNDYHVVWEIDITADSPEEAARLARKYQSPDTTALTFDVYDEYGGTTRVDLLENQ